MANGLEIPYSGYIETDIQICGHVVRDRGILIVKDVKGRNTPGLIGMNVISQCRDILATELQSRGCSSVTSSINRITADMKNTKEIRGFARIASKTDVLYPSEFNLDRECGRSSSEARAE